MELVCNQNKKKFLFLIFCIPFIVFVFTSDGHRYTLDEALGQEMALRMTTMQPDPNYIEGYSKNFFNIPVMNPNDSGPICTNGITCYPTSVFYSITQVPFITINHYFNLITTDTLILSVEDFHDQHYVFWRNTENKDLVFMELFYSPFFLAFSVTVFYLICLEHKFSRNTSLILTFLLAFSTMFWAYSNTSLNAAPTMFFILLGYLFYKKFQTSNTLKFSILSASSLGFAFLIREDTILFIIPLWILLLLNVLKKDSRVSLMFSFSIPLLFTYFVYRYIPTLRYNFTPEDSIVPLGGELSELLAFSSSTGMNLLTGVVGSLFSPGVGLFIFSPILLTVFFSFPDFFRKNRTDCLLFLSFFGMILLYHGYLQYWHGLAAWGPRYLFTIIPFLLIPLGASLEKRNKKFMFVLIMCLGMLGIFFNIPYVVQDVAWFVWGFPGEHTGLYGLGDITTSLYIHPNVIWTFQYSQLTQSLLLMFTGLQHDIYLLHVFGTLIYLSILISCLSISFYLFWRMMKYNNTAVVKS